MKMDFEQVWQAYGKAISRVAFTYEMNAAKREELVQEIAIACWQSMEQCREEKAIKAFFLRIAHNKSVDHVARQVREPKGNGDTLDSLPSHLNLDAGMQLSQQQSLMMSAIRKLPINQRQVISLMLEDMSYQEIAEITGLSLSNVGVLVNRAKQNLSEQLNAK